MPESTRAIDEPTLKRALHGMPVEGADCHRCMASLPCGEPVQVSTFQVTELPVLERFHDLPAAWLAGQARCRSCGVDALEPATEGFNEALVMAELAERNGAVSIDATSLTLVDTSPGSAGYLRPPIVLGFLAEHRDLSLARWFKIQTILEANDPSDSVVTPIQQAVSEAPERPPGVTAEMPDDVDDPEPPPHSHRSLADPGLPLGSSALPSAPNWTHLDARGGPLV